LDADLKVGTYIAQSQCSSTQSLKFDELGKSSSNEFLLSVSGTNSKLCLEIPRGSLALDEFVVIGNCDSTNAHQTFTIDNSAGASGVMFQVQHSKQCLNVEKSQLEDSARIEQWTCGSQYANQLFSTLTELPQVSPPPPPPPSTGKINSVTTIIEDMIRLNDYPPFGRNPNSCQYRGPCLVMGNLCGPEAFTPVNPYYKAEISWMSQATLDWLKSFGWTGIMQWGQVYQSAHGHGPNYKGNTRVQLRNLRLYQKRKNGQWFLVRHASKPGGAFYTSNFADPRDFRERIRTEASGGLSFTLPVSEARTYHFWWGDMIASEGAFDPSDIAAIFSTAEARVVLDDSNGPNDLDESRFVLAMGADYYPDRSMGANPVYPGVGTGRHKLITKEWQAFNMHTISEEELRANPPPIH
jgi:hypothetical protein